KMKIDNVAEKDLFYILDLFEKMGVIHWFDGGCGVDVLTGRQQREHRDIAIEFDAQHTQKVIKILDDIGSKIQVDSMPSRMELKNKEYGYLDIHPINLNDDGSITQVDPEGGNYIFQNEWFSETNYKGRKIPCISKEAQLLFHSGYELTEKDHFDIKNLKSIT